jgi:hypothetical protein
MTANGLRVVDDGRPYPYPPQIEEEDDDDADEEHRNQILPLVWKHHTTGRLSLMVNTRCMLCLELSDGTTLPVS